MTIGLHRGVPPAENDAPWSGGRRRDCATRRQVETGHFGAGPVGAVLVSALLALVVAGGGCDGGIAIIGRQDDAVTSPLCTPVCDGGAPCIADYCASIPRLSAPATIDGALECGLALQAVDPTHWFAPTAKPADLTAEYAAAWSDAGLYFFVHVHTSQRLPSPAAPGGKVYCGDAVHVFVDADGHFAAPPAYDADTLQLVAEAPANASFAASIGTVYSARAASGSGAWDAGRFRAFPVADGYVLETVVGAADLSQAAWTLTAGASIGFDLAVSYGGSPSEYADDPTCLKVGDFIFRTNPAPGAGEGFPYSDTGAFCAPTLAGR